MSVPAENMKEANAGKIEGEWPLGSGKMARLIRSYDWSGSELGAISSWPSTLKNFLDLILNSKFPMVIAWGPNLKFLYNDAYSDLIGAKHPKALGSSFLDIWHEVWPDILPFIDTALTGKSTWIQDLRLVMNRHGYDEETFFTFSYSPIIECNGLVSGIFCTVTETTHHVMNARLLQSEISKQRSFFELIDEGACIVEAVPATDDGKCDFRFLAMNRTMRSMYDLHELPETQTATVRELMPLVEDEWFEDLNEVLKTGTPMRTERMSHRGRFIEMFTACLPNTSDQAIVLLKDVTDTHHEKSMQTVINRELSHRMKNLLTVVLTICSHTLKGIADQDRVQILGKRLQALSRAHDVLLRSDHDAADIEQIVTETLSLLGHEERICFSGPSLQLGERSATQLALLLHELGTNAIKHGALSDANGRITFSWTISQEANAKFKAVWKERGGPIISSPNQSGFGSQLINLGLTGRGDTEQQYDEEGLTVTILENFNDL